jgi:hypothetical protein
MPFQSPNSEQRLRENGFSENEIRQLDESRDKLGNPITINIDSMAYQRMISERLSYITMMKNNGWTDEQVRKEINEYYNRSSKRNVFDFLKAEYRPPKRQDYWNNKRAEAKQGIDSEIEGYHGGEKAWDILTEEANKTPEDIEDEELRKLDEEVDYENEFDDMYENDDDNLFEDAGLNPDEISFRERGKYIPKKSLPSQEDADWFPDKDEIDDIQY